MNLSSPEVQNLISLVAGAIFGYIVKREKRILRLESLMREVRKDVKGIALVIGTPRAKAEQAELERKIKAKQLGIDSEQDDLDPLSIPNDSRQGSIKSPGATMLETLKKIASTLWMNHKKKVLTFIIGLILGAVAHFSGIPLEEIKSATHEASAPAVSQPAPASIPALEEK